MKKYKIKNKRNYNNEKGITLITLVVAVSIMIIISGMLIYNAKNGIKMRNLKMMQNDIDLLNNKVDAYYVKYGALPAEIEYNVTPLPFESYKSPNDNDKYYVLDLKAFEGLTLNYGADFSSVTTENVAEYIDIYVINEQSHHIYYVRGIEMDGVMYYTKDEDEKVTLNTRKWLQAIEGEFAIDNRNNFYQLEDGYIGTIKENTNYIKASDMVDIMLLETETLANKKITKIVNGSIGMMVLDNKGKVYTWGDNEYGQLGDGTTDVGYGKYSNVPICISDIEGNALNGKNIVSISNGIALDNEGKVYAWGANGYGQLGDGTTTNSSVPICISDIEGNALKGKNIINVYSNSDTIIAIDSEGKVYTWGYNRYGQLGNGTTTNSNAPICISDIEGNALKGKKIVDSSIKNSTVIVRDEDGKIYAWGSNGYGQLGDGTNANDIIPKCINDIEGNILNDKRIVEISVGSWHMVASDEDGKVYTWGDNEYGQLGDGTTTNSSVPICISDIEGNALNGRNIVGVYSDSRTVIAIDSEGKVFTWGHNYYGQLGDGTAQNSNIPICISDIEGNVLNGRNIVEACSSDTTIARDSEGKVYTWGNNDYGQLGDGNFYECYVPQCISNKKTNQLQEKKIIKMATSERSSTTAVVDIKGKVYTWGYNYYGELGDGTNANDIIPKCINDIEGNILNDKRIVEISVGSWHMVASDEDGKVYTWGNNNYGQLGNGTTVSSNTPICISEINEIMKKEKIVKVSAGDTYTVVINEKGKVYAWGAYDEYSSVNGTTEPICISDMTDSILQNVKIVEISSREAYTAALDENGKLYKLYKGTDPIYINEMNGIAIQEETMVKVSVGNNFIISIDSEGYVYTSFWIDGVSNNIMDLMEQGKKIVEVSANIYRVILIDEDGTIYTFKIMYD